MFGRFGAPRRRAPTAREWWTMLELTWSEFGDDHATRLGAALAYYTLFSLAPILVFAVGVAGLVFGEEAVRGELSRQLDGHLGPDAARLVETAVANMERSGGGLVATLLGAGALVIGASSVFVQLRGALDAMWDVKPAKQGVWSAVRTQALSFAMVLSVGFLLLVSLVASALLAGLGGFVSQALDVPTVVLQIGNQLVSIGVVTLLFAFVYKFLPSTRIAWGDVFVGALATAVLFTLGKFAIGEYLGRSSIASAYGAAGSLVVLLAWVYYSAQLVLFGAEFTHVYARRRGSRRVLGPLLPLGRRGRAGR